jgi:hypothetical protein
MRNLYKIFVRKPEEKTTLKIPRHRWKDNSRTDLREIVLEGGLGLDSFGSGQGPVARSCEHGNELSGSIKGGKFLDGLSDYRLFKKDSAPRS